MVKRYRRKMRQKLDEGKVRYIVRAREKGESASNVALHLAVSKRRVEQLYSAYKYSHQVPSLRKGGRRPKPITDEERRVVLAAYSRYMVNAVYLKSMIETDYGVHINQP